ncbi:fumarylacetoacetate hydrolase family protein [Microbacterium terregens]|uniref:Fumarylacetoacetate hydrolase family protein n=1 Tax=Microbacterium terregens TaxID=69363 RepID=A0ABV5SWK6_9MICO
MRIANLSGRAVLIHQGHAVDIAGASSGRFGPAPRAIFDAWDEFTHWSASTELPVGDEFDPAALGPPIPDPRQIFAIGLNYRDHADEAGLAYPEHIVVFTKFASSLAGPEAKVTLPSAFVDFETELVVVVGSESHRLRSLEDARLAIAGYAVGQDYSERAVQLRGPVPQFSLGKSYPAFAPFGPAVVTRDELGDPDSLRITARITGPTAEAQGASPFTLQDGSTADLIFSVEQVIHDLSQVVTLYPGDLIFTGTPAGVGGTRGIFLQPGDRLISTIDGIGSLDNRFIDGAGPDSR